MTAKARGFSTFWSATAKTAKAPPGWRNIILLLSPSRAVPLARLCPHAGLCAAVCLRYTGRNPMPVAHAAQQARAQLWARDPVAFSAGVTKELQQHAERAQRDGMRLCARFDGLSDTGWGGRLAPRFPEVTFVDYTKDRKRYRKWLEGPVTNWHLVFSRDSEKDDPFCREVLEGGLGSVAIVFTGSELPAMWEDWAVIDGDAHDVRALDPPGIVVGLRAKGARLRGKSTRFKVEVSNA